MTIRPVLPSELQLHHTLVQTTLRHYWLPAVLRTTLHGTEHLPDGPALLVGNHGPMALDTGLLVHALHRDVGRIPRTLGDRFMFKTRLGRHVAHAWGGVEASPDAALRLLGAGEWVLVYPGGARETMRGPDERYTLCWEGRLGFARTALCAHVPVVPVACIGLDESFNQLLTREQALSTAPGKLLARIAGSDYVPPLFLPKLRATQFHYWIGEPIPPGPRVESPSDSEAAALQQRVKRALESLMAHGRAVRRKRLYQA